MKTPSAPRRRASGLHALATKVFPPACSSALVIASLFFLGSLTPGLVPRSATAQALLSGACLAVGYGFGVMLRGLWTYLELPVPRAVKDGRARKAALVVSAVIFLVASWRGQAWNDVIGRLMHLPPAGASRPLVVGTGALLVALLLLTLGRGAARLVRWATAVAARHLPRRVATLLGSVVAGLLLIGLVNGVIVRTVLNGLDSSYRAADELIPPDKVAPSEPERPGSPQSLVAWNELGNMGRRFVAGTPTAEALRELAGPTAKTPLRVYAGLPAAGSPEERARLALAELKRVGGFSRAALLIITPTGTGWVDPAAIDSIEYLYRGDIASVAVQYSYLSSPLTLLVDPETGAVTARALFREVYGHWRTLPPDLRPKLYLHGLSLGAFNSERSFDMFELLGDPVDGALWSGPPFASTHWRAVTDARNPGTPIWRPQFRDGAFVRFMNQHGPGTPHGTPWGPMRIVYLQYASDAITFFDPRGFLRKPAWLQEPRGPDVSAHMRWIPVVTMIQTGLDMPLSMDAPMGFGHVYSPAHYIAAWLEVTGIEDWEPDDVARLQRALDQRQLQRAEEPGGG